MHSPKESQTHISKIQLPSNQNFSTLPSKPVTPLPPIKALEAELNIHPFLRNARLWLGLQELNVTEHASQAFVTEIKGRCEF